MNDMQRLKMLNNRKTEIERQMQFRFDTMIAIRRGGKIGQTRDHYIFIHIPTMIDQSL